MSVIQKPDRVSKAFIYQGDRLLLQLRDNRPDIIHPNKWGLFGGSIEPGETPEQTIKREIEEEIGWKPPEVKYILTWKEEKESWETTVFGTRLTVDTSELILTEGQDLGLFTLEELKQLPIVPKIHKMLPQAVEAIAYPPLTAAWQVLSNKELGCHSKNR